MPTIVIWTACPGDAPTKESLRGPALLSARGVEPIDLESRPSPSEGVLLIPTVSPGTLCVLLVPPDLPAPASKNGAALRSGLFRLRHADFVEYSGHVVWTSGERAPEVVEYDPELHGPDLFCFRTKTRLQSSERIVICPGLPSQPHRCGRIFRETAWSSETRCHQCGFDVALPEWRPPSSPRRRELQRILSLAMGG